MTTPPVAGPPLAFHAPDRSWYTRTGYHPVPHQHEQLDAFDNYGVKTTYVVVQVTQRWTVGGASDPRCFEIGIELREVAPDESQPDLP